MLLALHEKRTLLNFPPPSNLQCFTKYKWRDEAVAKQSGGPVIVATQVVSDFLTAYDGEALYMRVGSHRHIHHSPYRPSYLPLVLLSPARLSDAPSPSCALCHAAGDE